MTARLWLLAIATLAFTALGAVITKLLALIPMR